MSTYHPPTATSISNNHQVIPLHPSPHPRHTTHWCQVIPSHPSPHPHAMSTHHPLSHVHTPPTRCCQALETTLSHPSPTLTPDPSSHHSLNTAYTLAHTLTSGPHTTHPLLPHTTHQLLPSNYLSTVPSHLTL